MKATLRDLGSLKVAFTDFGRGVPNGELAAAASPGKAVRGTFTAFRSVKVPLTDNGPGPARPRKAVRGTFTALKAVKVPLTAKRAGEPQSLQVPGVARNSCEPTPPNGRTRTGGSAAGSQTD